MKCLNKLKDKIIKWLGGYTAKEYNDNLFKPLYLSSPCYSKKLHPVEIFTRLEVNHDAYMNFNTEQIEKIIKETVISNLINKVVRNERELVSYQISDTLSGGKIISAKITVIKDGDDT